MSGIQQILLSGPFGGAVAAAGDPYWQYTTLLSGTGTTNGAQNNTFTDSSSNAFSITRNGNTTQGSFSPFSAPNGYWGNYFDGSGDYLELSSNAAYSFGTGDFTVEAWVYGTNFTGYSGWNGIFTAPGSIGVYIGTSGVRVTQSGVSLINDFSATLTTNTWYHVAITRSGTSLKAFVNGSQIGSTVTNSTNFSNTGAPRIGTETVEYLGGYISNLRIVKGTAVYTSNFTPPTSPLTAITNTSLLTCQSNRFIDNSTNAFAITANGNVAVVPFANFGNTTAYSASSVGGSGYFDGSGDYLSLASNSAFALPGEYTIDFWYYPNVLSGETPFIWGTTSNAIALYADTSSQLILARNGANEITSTGVLKVGQWHHIVYCRNSSNVSSIYLNGTRVGTATVSTSYATSALDIGLKPSSVYANGYISNLRIVKGTDVYGASNTTITVPSSPVTAISGTSLLLNYTNAGIYDQAAKNDMETVGNAQVSTSVKKYGDGSIAFDGTGDWLTMPAGTNFAFGTGEFTIEAWIYPTTIDSYDSIFSTGTYNTTQVDFRLDAGKLNFYVGNGGSIYVVGSTTLSTNTWYHVAATRSGTTLKLYVNGNQEATSTVSTNLLSSGTAGIGTQVGNSWPFNGYISDLRVTNGINRYPYNFTPPAQKFANFYSAPVTTTDPYFDYTTLLLPGSGTNGAQNNTFLDSSTNAFSITRNGNTTQGTFSPFSQTGWSNYFDGTGDYLSLGTNSAFDLGTGDFSIECWAYPLSTATNKVWIGAHQAGQADGYYIYLNPFQLQVYSNGGSGGGVTSNIAPTVNAWNHLLVTRQSGRLRCFLNGVLTDTNATSYTINQDARDLRIGNLIGSAEINAYLSNVRFIKGSVPTAYQTSSTAIGTSVFTPSTTAITTTSQGATSGDVKILTCQSNRFVDNSSNAFAITVAGNTSVQAFSPFAPTAAYSAATNGGSGYFDGTVDYLTYSTPAASVREWWANDFTVEAWIYPTNLSTWASSSGGVRPSLVGNMNHNDGTNYWSFGPNTDGNVYLYYYNGSAQTINSSLAVKANQWNHIAFTKTSGGVTFFVNGVGSSTTAISGTPQSSNTVPLTVGGGNSVYITGNVSGLRIINGTAQYSGATYTVPSAPPTAITNTSLLLNYTNAGITDATAKNDLETVGNAQISNTTAKFGSTSMYFDGTGDYLVTSPSEVNNLSAGDWTVEFWCYPTSASSSKTLINAATSASDPNGTHIWMNTSRQLVVDNTATGQSAFSGGTLTLNTWNHVAIVRYGGTTTGYINGSSVGSNTYTPNTNKVIAVGYLIANAGYDFAGYIQDLRVTKGIARYTQNFTPPTAAFQLL